MADTYIKDITATAPSVTDKIPVSNGGSLPKVVTVQSVLDMVTVKSISSIVRTSGTGAAGTVDTYTITYSGGTTSTFQVRNGADGIIGADGAKGDTGATGAKGDTGLQGTAGTNGANGANGTDGVSIVSITQTAGNHAPGTTDTYTITLSNSATCNFTVYNGLDGASGSGSGDMLKATYDTNNNGKVDVAAVADAVAWTGVSGKPTEYTPTAHAHTGVYAPVLGADDNYVTDTEKAALHSHANKTALDLVSGTNTGDQDLSGYATTGHTHTGIYAPALGADDNYITDAEKTALHAHSNKTALDLVSGENTGDQDLSGLQATLVSGTNIKTINSQSLLGSGDITISGGGSTTYGFFKSDSSSVVFTKTAAGTISIKAGTSIMVASTLVTIATDTAVVMLTLSAGTDYAIYACTDGTVRADASFTAPTGYTTANSRMIGGFHYGLVAAGTTVAGGSFATTGSGMIWTQTDVDKIAGINQYSLWDLKWRPQCDPRGMALVAGRTWVDIYFCSTNHIANGTSKAGTDIASGTVLPRKPLEFGGNGTATYSAPTWWDFSEIVNSHKKRLIREQEFVLAAFGVTENQSIDATASTYPTTQRNAGYTSKYGLEQASGHHWIWGEDSAGSASEYVANGGRGQSYNNSIIRALLGGSRTNGAYSGSRCSVWSRVPTIVSWYNGVRAVADHTILI